MLEELEGEGHIKQIEDLNSYCWKGEEEAFSAEELKEKLTEQLEEYLINAKKIKENGSANITCDEVSQALKLQNLEKKLMREIIESQGLSLGNLEMPGYYCFKAKDLEEEKQQDEKSLPQRILEHFEKHLKQQDIEEIAEALGVEVDSRLKTTNYKICAHIILLQNEVFIKSRMRDRNTLSKASLSEIPW